MDFPLYRNVEAIAKSVKLVASAEGGISAESSSTIKPVYLPPLSLESGAVPIH